LHNFRFVSFLVFFFTVLAITPHIFWNVLNLTTNTIPENKCCLLQSGAPTRVLAMCSCHSYWDRSEHSTLFHECFTERPRLLQVLIGWQQVCLTGCIPSTSRGATLNIDTLLWDGLLPQQHYQRATCYAQPTRNLEI
jgi:hypothetical protein